MQNKIPLLSILAIMAAAFLSGCSVFGASNVAEAKYQVLEKDGDFELRNYESLVLAETVVDQSYDDYSSTAFRRLFKYISGDNQLSAEISMTAPVHQEPVGKKIAMTAPVIQQSTGDSDSNSWKMAFVLPAEYDYKSAPLPKNPDVKLREIPQRKVAVIQYSGSLSNKSFKQKTEQLQDWLDTKGLTAVSQPVSAGFDPPWTIPSLRRNEVQIDVK